MELVLSTQGRQNQDSYAGTYPTITQKESEEEWESEDGKSDHMAIQEVLISVQIWLRFSADLVTLFRHFPLEILKDNPLIVHLIKEKVKKLLPFGHSLRLSKEKELTSLRKYRK